MATRTTTLRQRTRTELGLFQHFYERATYAAAFLKI